MSAAGQAPKPGDYGPLYKPLLALSVLAAAAAVLTLIPNPGASWPSVLGYKSLCTFAPAATFACALAAGLVCVLRARLVRRRPGPAFVPVAVLGLLTIGFAVSAYAWAAEKAKYVDAAAAASLSE